VGNKPESAEKVAQRLESIAGAIRAEMVADEDLDDEELDNDAEADYDENYPDQ
jgi:hypothetical protein